MSRAAALVLASFVVAVVAMTATDTTSSRAHNVWHVYDTKTPVTP